VEVNVGGWGEGVEEFLGGVGNKNIGGGGMVPRVGRGGEREERGGGEKGEESQRFNCVSLELFSTAGHTPPLGKSPMKGDTKVGEVERYRRGEKETVAAMAGTLRKDGRKASHKQKAGRKKTK